MWPPTEDYPRAHDRRAARDVAAGMAGAHDPPPAVGARLRGRAADRGGRRPWPGMADPEGGRLPLDRPPARRGLIVPEGTEPGLGPQRTVYSATAAGREAADRWLHAPVEHVRDIRSELLLKLALLDRAGENPADLLRAQRAVLEPIVEAIESRRARSAGFDATLLAWRRATRGRRPGLPRHHRARRVPPPVAAPPSRLPARGIESSRTEACFTLYRHPIRSRVVATEVSRSRSERHSGRSGTPGCARTSTISG